MKIKYEFINGETVEVEVEDEIGRVIIEMDKREKANNHAETRRHSKLDSSDDKSSWLIEYLEGETFIRCGGKTFRHGDRRIKNAFSNLTAKQKELVIKHIIREISVEEYAKEKEMTERAVWRLKKRALEKMKNNL